MQREEDHKEGTKYKVQESKVAHFLNERKTNPIKMRLNSLQDLKPIQLTII